MVKQFLRRLFGLGCPQKEKLPIVSTRPTARSHQTDLSKTGRRADIDIVSSKYIPDARPWYSVDGAAYIPTNEGNFISLTLAKKMGLVALDDNREVIAETFELRWRGRNLGPDDPQYWCQGQFAIRKDLPSGVIFGKHDPNMMLPEYPSPFEKAPKENFPESYGPSRPLATASRTNSWEKTRWLLGKTTSWTSSEKSKAKSRQSSFSVRKSPIPQSTNTFDLNKPIRTNTDHRVGSSQAAKRDGAFTNRAGSLNTGSGQDAVGQTAGLATIPSNGSAESNEDEIGVEARSPTSIALPQATIAAEGVEEHQSVMSENIALGSISETGPSYTFAISMTPEVALMKSHDHLDSGQDSSRQTDNFVECSMPPGSSTAPYDNAARLMTVTHVSPPRKPSSGLWFQSAAERSLPANPRLNEDGEGFLQKGEKDRQDVEKVTPDDSISHIMDTANIGITHPEQKKNNQEVRWKQRHEDTERKNEEGAMQRIGREDAKMNGKMIDLRDSQHSPLRDPDLWAEDVLLVKSLDRLRAQTVQSLDDGSQALAACSPRSKSLDLELEKEVDRGIPARSGELPSLLEIGDHSARSEEKPVQYQAEQKTHEASPTNALHLTTNESNSQVRPTHDMAFEGLLSTVHGLSGTTELPAGHGEVTSYGMKRYLESGPDFAGEEARSPESRSKQHTQKRGKAPTIKLARGDRVDLTPAPNADEYWTYDEATDNYFHVDSDTGSRHWYEDSDEESR